MLDPSARVRLKQRRGRSRRGAIVPLFAILLPMLLIFAGFAINLAYMQLVTTELKITTDCAAHAGGRAMSVAQTDDTLTKEQKRVRAINDGIAKAKEIAQANPVLGRVLSVGENGSDSDIEILFGRSIRENGTGKYVFEEVTMEEINAEGKRPSSLAVVSNLELPMIFNVMRNNAFSHTDAQGNTEHYAAHNIDSFAPTRRSVATQIDRDIALVLDRSGSMLYYRDDNALSERLRELYDNPEEITVPGGWKYHYWRRHNGYYYDRGYRRPEDAHSSWVIRNSSDRQWENTYTYDSPRISWDEYSWATEWLYDRYYYANVIYQLEKWENASHTLGSGYSEWENYKLTSEMAMFCHDWKYNSSGAARYSRWWYLDQGVTAFLDVLDITDQEELVSLVTFNNSATLNFGLKKDYDEMRTYISGITPYGGTAIGDGMTEGLPPIVNGIAARPFAAKTIVVLTDGVSNAGEDPVTAVENIVGSNLVSVHTVTFTPGADKTAMAEVARLGQGRHYHADDGSALVSIFEEIANNLPTILTE